jgi:GNAT superfamily N-acetyltransferase
MKKIRIEEASNQDATLIADLSRKTFTDTFANQNTAENMEKFLSTQFSSAQLIAEVGQPEYLYYLAWVDEQAAGYAKLIRSITPLQASDGPTAEVARLYIDKPYQGLSLGTLLLQQCIDWSRANQISTLLLGVWEHNHKAIRFYEKMGFIRSGAKDFVLGDDVQQDWIMTLKISA